MPHQVPDRQTDKATHSLKPSVVSFDPGEQNTSHDAMQNQLPDKSMLSNENTPFVYQPGSTPNIRLFFFSASIVGIVALCVFSFLMPFRSTLSFFCGSLVSILSPATALITQKESFVQKKSLTMNQVFRRMLAISYIKLLLGVLFAYGAVKFELNIVSVLFGFLVFPVGVFVASLYL